MYPCGVICDRRALDYARARIPAELATHPYRARFVQSYQSTCPTVRDVGYSEMTDHRFLTPDRAVQQTAFANGTRITVNFGNAPYQLSDGITLPPMGKHVAKGK